jgi:hypothetical protein
MSYEQISYKERVCRTVSSLAGAYQSYYVDYDYLLCSTAFAKRPYYIVSAEKNNYQHLTGVSFSASADAFFETCINGTLTEADISFSKGGRSEAEIKGSVRRKIKALPDMIGIFSSGCLVQEDFSKNRIFCSFAATDISCTVGFTVAANTKPMTLLNGNQLDTARAQPLELVLRRKRGDAKFGCIMCGTVDDLVTYEAILSGMLAEPLQSLIDEAKKVPDDSEPNEEYSDEISLEGNDSEREVNSETSEPAEQASD